MCPRKRRSATLPAEYPCHFAAGGIIKFTTSADTGIDEIFAFQPIPEPASLSLLALGGLALLRRRDYLVVIPRQGDVA